jgi:Holliday junction resolvasome RuvABC endonuclease subunit
VSAPIKPGYLYAVGIDQSLTSTGLAAIHGAETTVWRLRYPTRKPSQDVRIYQHERLDYLAEGVRNAICGADVVAIEDMAFGAKGDALTDLAGLFWMVRHILWQHHVPYVVINSSHRRKWITGRGDAPKDEVLTAAIKRFPHVDVRGNDEADALVLAAMTSDHYGWPIAQMPADRTALLNGVHTTKAKRAAR